MEGFYSLASIDYRHLAEKINWKLWFETRQKRVGSRCMQLLDVACGSGKFPTALTARGDIADALIRPIEYSLLDPSIFSITEARKALKSPFNLANEYQTKLQDFNIYNTCFDVVWAVHALYAIPKIELRSSVISMLRALGYGKNNSGVGFIAHASINSHYLKFFNYYLSGFKRRLSEPYTAAEQIISILNQEGVCIEIKEINYVNEASKNMEKQVEKYLQRCIFDDTVSLEEMRTNSVTGPYLESCLTGDIWQFEQCVKMIFINNSDELGVY
ncbi:MAG: hypothetical protein CMK56_01795 [Proteobacteria bacterium]|nr:hypothetical protein [Pseudomonadota bacterium]